MKKTAITTLAICGIFASSALAQNLLLNGSFESPLIPSNTFQTGTPNDWTSGGPIGYIFNGVPANDTGLPGSWPGPEDGLQYVDIGDNSAQSLSQTFTVSSAVLTHG